ncbi:MAG: TraX family protein [Lautropia sp.]
MLRAGPLDLAQQPRRIHPAILSDGSIEALKWIAAILMVGDHVNRYLLVDANPWLFYGGRLAMPIFGILLGLNLSRPSALSGKATDRTVGRLFLMGLIATVPYMLLGAPIKGPWPLNILFTLAVAALAIEALQLGTRQGWWMAVVVFLFGGAFVEFWWPGVAVVLGTWLWRMGARKSGWTMFGCGMLGLCAINGNFWAFAAIPVIAIAAMFEPKIARHRAFFYVFYPLHLAVILAVALLNR